MQKAGQEAGAPGSGGKPSVGPTVVKVKSYK